MKNKTNTENFFDNVSTSIIRNNGCRWLKLIAGFMIPLVLGAVITIAVVMIFAPSSSRSFFHHLCNALFAASVILIGVGGLTLVNKEGFFDIVLFGFKQLKETIKYGISMQKNKRISTDFISFKNEKYLKRIGRWSWVIVGLLYLIAAFIVLQFV